MYYKEAAGQVVNRIYDANINTFSGGMKAWKEAGYPIVSINPLDPFEIEYVEASALKKNFKDFCIVDIRMRKHYAAGYFSRYLKEELQSLSSSDHKKYIHKIPLPYLSKLYKKIPSDKKVVVIDFKGKQAPLAARYLREKGYHNVSMLKGGLSIFEKKSDI